MQGKKPNMYVSVYVHFVGEWSLKQFSYTHNTCCYSLCVLIFKDLSIFVVDCRLSSLNKEDINLIIRYFFLTLFPINIPM